MGTGPGRPRYPRLTRARVIQGALELVERDGAEALTMRRLGDELGVHAMSLYNHVANRDAVLDGIGELLMSEIDLSPDRGWQTVCRQFAAQLRAITLAHPNAFQLIGLRPLAGPAALAPVERLLEVLVADGASPELALGIYRAIASYARGYALAEVAGFTVDASTATARRRLQDLDADEFPILRGQRRELSALEADDGFACGLDAMLTGFASALG